MVEVRILAKKNKVTANSINEACVDRISNRKQCLLIISVASSLAAVFAFVLCLISPVTLALRPVSYWISAIFVCWVPLNCPHWTTLQSHFAWIFNLFPPTIKEKSTFYSGPSFHRIRDLNLTSKSRKKSFVQIPHTQFICYEIKVTEMLIDSKALDMVQKRNVHFTFFFCQ